MDQNETPQAPLLITGGHKNRKKVALIVIGLVVLVGGGLWMGSSKLFTGRLDPNINTDVAANTAYTEADQALTTAKDTANNILTRVRTQGSDVRSALQHTLEAATKEEAQIFANVVREIRTDQNLAHTQRDTANTKTNAFLTAVRNIGANADLYNEQTREIEERRIELQGLNIAVDREVGNIIAEADRAVALFDARAAYDAAFAKSTEAETALTNVTPKVGTFVQSIGVATEGLSALERPATLQEKITNQTRMEALDNEWSGKIQAIVGEAGNALNLSQEARRLAANVSNNIPGAAELKIKTQAFVPQADALMSQINTATTAWNTEKTRVNDALTAFEGGMQQPLLADLQMQVDAIRLRLADIRTNTAQIEQEKAAIALLTAPRNNVEKTQNLQDITQRDGVLRDRKEALLAALAPIRNELDVVNNAVATLVVADGLAAGKNTLLTTINDDLISQADRKITKITNDFESWTTEKVRVLGIINAVVFAEVPVEEPEPAVAPVEPEPEPVAACVDNCDRPAVDPAPAPAPVAPPDPAAAQEQAPAVDGEPVAPIAVADEPAPAVNNPADAPVAPVAPIAPVAAAAPAAEPPAAAPVAPVAPAAPAAPIVAVATPVGGSTAGPATVPLPAVPILGVGGGVGGGDRTSGGQTPVLKEIKSIGKKTVKKTVKNSKPAPVKSDTAGLTSLEKIKKTGAGGSAARAGSAAAGTQKSTAKSLTASQVNASSGSALHGASILGKTGPELLLYPGILALVSGGLVILRGRRR